MSMTVKRAALWATLPDVAAGVNAPGSTARLVTMPDRGARTLASPGRAAAGGAAAEGAGFAWRQAAEKARAPPSSEAGVWGLAAAFMIGGAPKESSFFPGGPHTSPRVRGSPSRWAGPTAGRRRRREGR